MLNIGEILFYVISFLALYVQVFMLVTYLQKKREIVIRTEPIALEDHPAVTILVPCYNEERTLALTVDSLLELDYPKDKLHIIIIDDGSKDNTWQVAKLYADNSQIKLIQKENGGKHTALNKGLEEVCTAFVGCLDADSSVHPEALKRIMTFFSDSTVMAVAPSIIVRDPKTLIQYAQRAEYDMSHYNKKMLAFMGAIHVTPGPFSIFRKKVFDDLGPYRKAHNTEDQEIALRMHTHGYKIDHCPDAYVYTNSPNTIGKLYRQRVRWTYGFLRNAKDYRHLLFRPQYGNVGIFTIPSGLISLSGTILLVSLFLTKVASFIQDRIVQYQATGVAISFGSNFRFDWFFLSTKMMIFVSAMLYIFIIVALVNGRSMTERRRGFPWDIILFVIFYSVVAPFWALKSFWNALWARETSWTAERASSSV